MTDRPSQLWNSHNAIKHEDVDENSDKGVMFHQSMPIRSKVNGRDMTGPGSVSFESPTTPLIKDETRKNRGIPLASHRPGVTRGYNPLAAKPLSWRRSQFPYTLRSDFVASPPFTRDNSQFLPARHFWRPSLPISRPQPTQVPPSSFTTFGPQTTHATPNLPMLHDPHLAQYFPVPMYHGFQSTPAPHVFRGPQLFQTAPAPFKGIVKQKKRANIVAINVLPKNVRRKSYGSPTSQGHAQAGAVFVEMRPHAKWPSVLLIMPQGNGRDRISCQIFGAHLAEFKMRWGAQVQDAFLDHHHNSNLAAHAEQNKLLQLHMTFKEGCHPVWKNSEKADRDNWLRMMVDDRETLTITEEMQAWLRTSTKVVVNCICVHDNIQQFSAFFTDQMRQASLHGGLQQPSPSQPF